MPLLKTLSRLRQIIAFLSLILFLMFACNNIPFRAFVTMTNWTSTEVLVNLVAALDSAVTSGFDPVRIVFDPLGVSRSLTELCFSHLI